MKIDVQLDHATKRITFTPSRFEGDRLANFFPIDVYFQMPEEIALERIHPDLLSLAGLLIFSPHIKNEVEFNLDASEEFTFSCQQQLEFKVVFANTGSIPPRESGATPALAFSGGVDSTVCLDVMPPHTVPIFLDRTSAEKQSTSVYDKDAALSAIAHLRELDYPALTIATNVEYSRNPIGFPVDWANGVPAILLADRLDLSSISWGTIAESAFRLGHSEFMTFHDRKIYSRWRSLLLSVGLELGTPTAGLSEVATSDIVRRSIFKDIAQSCIRGKTGQPCGKCFKCFRKILLDMALCDEVMPSDRLNQMMQVKSLQKYLISSPIKHENVFRYIARHLRVEGSSEKWESLKSALLLDEVEIDFLRKWYPKSERFIPADFRDYTLKRIASYVTTMSPEDISRFEGWNLGPALASPQRAQLLSKISASD